MAFSATTVDPRCGSAAMRDGRRTTLELLPRDFHPSSSSQGSRGVTENCGESLSLLDSLLFDPFSRRVSHFFAPIEQSRLNNCSRHGFCTSGSGGPRHLQDEGAERGASGKLPMECAANDCRLRRETTSLLLRRNTSNNGKRTRYSSQTPLRPPRFLYTPYRRSSCGRSTPSSSGLWPSLT